MSEKATERPRIIYLFGPEDETLWCVDDNSDEEFPATTYIIKSNYDELASIAGEMAGLLENFAVTGEEFATLSRYNKWAEKQQ